MCLWAISSTLEGKWKEAHPMNAPACPSPPILRTEWDWNILADFQERWPLPGRRLSDFPLGFRLSDEHIFPCCLEERKTLHCHCRHPEITSVKIELLILLWRRAWPPSLPCDQHSVGDCGPAPSLERELGKFSDASACSWSWAWAHSLMDSQWLSCSPEVDLASIRNIHIPLRPDVVALCNSVDYGILLTWVCSMCWLAGAAFILSIHPCMCAFTHPFIQ